MTLSERDREALENVAEWYADEPVGELARLFLQSDEEEAEVTSS